MSNTGEGRKSTLGDRIRAVRLAHDLTQKEFADALGIVQGYLSGIERNKKVPSTMLLYAICHKWNLSEDWVLHGQDNQPRRAVAPKDGSLGKNIVKTPLLKKITEKFPHGAGEDETAGFVYLPDVPDGCFAIIADGDYMAPTIRDGDLVIFRPDRELRNKSIVLLNNRWGEIILRRCRMNGGETYFSPENAVYTPFKADSSTRIFGIVVSVWRNVRI